MRFASLFCGRQDRFAVTLLAVSVTSWAVLPGRALAGIVVTKA
jgi:hypothetical protein